MKSTLRVLVLVLVQVLVQAGGEDCADLRKTLRPEELSQVQGSWVLVWAVSDSSKGQSVIPKVTSQHLTLSLVDDRTLSYDEKSSYSGRDHTCARFMLNATVADGNDDNDCKLEASEGTSVYDGREVPIEVKVSLSFYQSSEDGLILTFRSPFWTNFYLVFKREGHHTDAVTQQTKDEFMKRARCLGFPTEPAFTYDGHSGFCYHTTPTTHAEF